MSHFVGLVIITPDYKGSLEDALEKYNENREVEPHFVGKVSAVSKFYCVDNYAMSKDEKNEFYNKVIKHIKGLKGDDFYTLEKYKEEYKSSLSGKTDEEIKEQWARYLIFAYHDELEEYIINNTNIPSRFNDVYKLHGKEWDGNRCKLNDNGEWEEWSTYNPDSKWDWYSTDNWSRWNGFLRTKDGSYVNNCLLGDIDIHTPNGDKSDTLHFADDFYPFCVIVDGEWYEKAKMGWWAITTDDMSEEDWKKKVDELLSNLPSDSEVTAVDFHI